MHTGLCQSPALEVLPLLSADWPPEMSPPGPPNLEKLPYMAKGLWGVRKFRTLRWGGPWWSEWAPCLPDVHLCVGRGDAVKGEAGRCRLARNMGWGGHKPRITAGSLRRQPPRLPRGPMTSGQTGAGGCTRLTALSWWPRRTPVLSRWSRGLQWMAWPGDPQVGSGSVAVPGPRVMTQATKGLRGQHQTPLTPALLTLTEYFWSYLKYLYLIGDKLLSYKGGSEFQDKMGPRRVSLTCGLPV